MLITFYKTMAWAAFVGMAAGNLHGFLRMASHEAEDAALSCAVMCGAILASIVVSALA